MPSPIGHALAGAAIAWTLHGLGRWRVAALCAAFAVLPDIDLLYLPAHRTATHSIPVAILLTIIAVAVTGWVRPVPGRCQAGVRHRSDTAPMGAGVVSDPYPIGLACGLAWSSHVLLDWLGADASVPYGIQALWPFSTRGFMSGWDVFPGTERREPFAARAMRINLRAAVQETAIMGAIALAVWWARRRR